MAKIKREQIILGSIIAAIVITASTLTYVILTQTEAKFGYSLLERIDFAYDSEEEITTIDFSIVNDEGSIFISYEEELESLIEAENRFYGKRDAILEDATNFTAVELGDTVSIDYNAPALYNTSDPRSFYNNLHIKIRADLTVKYNITTTTGDIYLVFDSVLTQTVISQLNVFSSLGDVSIEFGDNTAVDSSTLNTQILDGTLDINFDAVELLSTIDMWNITSREGDIEFRIDQSDLIGTNNATFNVLTTSGKATMKYKFNDETGFQVSAITGTGDITSDVEIPDAHTPYQNEVFPAVENYIFAFETGTGNIKISKIVF
jgi:hypothetical protein